MIKFNRFLARSLGREFHQKKHGPKITFPFLKSIEKKTLSCFQSTRDTFGINQVIKLNRFLVWSSGWRMSSWDSYRIYTKFVNIDHYWMISIQNDLKIICVLVNEQWFCKKQWKTCGFLMCSLNIFKNHTKSQGFFKNSCFVYKIHTKN